MHDLRGRVFVRRLGSGCNHRRVKRVVQLNILRNGAQNKKIRCFSRYMLRALCAFMSIVRASQMVHGHGWLQEVD